MNIPESTDSSGRGADPHRREPYEPQPGFGAYEPGAYESGPGAYAGATDLLDFPPLPPYTDSDTPYAEAASPPDAAFPDAPYPEAPYAETPYPDAPYPDVPFAETQYQEPDLEPAPPPGPEPGGAGLRVTRDAEATARLLIRLPASPPQPSTTLRPHAVWEDRGSDGPAPDGVPGARAAGAPATPFAQVAASPARPSALPSELAALTTATLVVPLPRDSRPTPALVTTTLPPDKAAQANAAALADAFHDTLEQVFGLDLDSVSAADVGLASPAGQPIGADEAELDADLPGDWFRDDTGSQLKVRPDSLAGFSGSEPAGPQPLDEAEIDAVDLSNVEMVDGEFTDVDQAPYEYVLGVVTAAAFGGRYGVPTLPAAFPGFSAQDPHTHDSARHALALRYLGGIFHDSTGESSYLDPDSYAARALHDSTSALALAPIAEPDAPTEQLRRIPAQAAGSSDTAVAVHSRRELSRAARRATAEESEAAYASNDGVHADTGTHARASARTDEHEAGRRRGSGRLLTAVVVLAAAFAILYGLALVLVSGVFGGNVPRNTVVGGVSIGGMNPADAESAITAGLGARARRPLPLLIGQVPTTIDPTSSGLLLDVTASVQAAQRDRTNPLVIIPALFGRRHEVAPVATVDLGALTRTFTTIAGSYNSPIIEGGITFDHAVPVVTAPKEGRGFSVAGAVEAVRSGYLHVSGPIRIPVQTLQPKASPAALQAALEQYARPAVSAPITLVTGTVNTQLTPTQIGDALTISPDAGGRMVPHVDGTRLRGYLGTAALAQEQAPANASFTINNGQPVLVPARDGRGFSPDALATAVLPALTERAPRTATVAVGNLPAAFSTADAQALGVTDVIGSSSLPVAEAPNRFTNVARATTLIAGNIIQPGDTWSFLKTVGALTAANGFATSAAAEHAGVDPSGGVDTVATAAFDAAFAAGMGDTMHHPHASYVDRYPVGLDAAVVAPGTDLQWTNTSGHPVYLYASYANGSLTVALLGEKQYDQVNVQVSQRTAIVQPSASSGSASGSAASCDQGAVAGFQVDVTRTLMRDGGQVGTEQFHVSYAPQGGEHCASGSGSTPSPGTAVSSAPTKSPTAGARSGSGGGGSGGGGHSGGGGGSAPSPSPSPSSSGLLGGLIH